MKQVIQSLKTGDVAVIEVPAPLLRERGVLVRTVASAVSPGTERSIVAFAGKNLLDKASARPDLARQAIDTARRDGLLPTIERVRGRLEQPLALGYSSAGVILEVGADAGHFQAGDLVACAGGGYACHAEVAYVPRTLCVKLPDTVPFESAAFTTLGAVALHGVRQGEVMLGHKVAVIGLGLIGQLTAQIARAAGADVFVVDLIEPRVELALRLGASAGCHLERARNDGLDFTAGRGFDAVLITADTPGSQPVELAGDIARDRGIVVAVGAVGLTVPRRTYYQKELELRLSRSYGPGRYDPEYEEKGHDYPYGYVRWTEQRNMEAFVQLLANGAVQVEPLITHRFPVEQAPAAYDLLAGKGGGTSLGVVLTYPAAPVPVARVPLRPIDHAETATVVTPAPAPRGAPLRLGLVGAGSFANATLLPAIRELEGIELVGIVSASGLTARHTGERFGFAYCSSDTATLLGDDRINWLAIVTRHHLHARQAIEAMRAGKDVFVEKPLAMNRAELVEVIRAREESGRSLLVGFNRRFAPFALELRRFLGDRGKPLVASCRVNAGAIPSSHWTQDPTVGGGRVVGEVCHFIDLLQFLVDAPPVEIFAHAVQTDAGPVADETVISLTFADGSAGSVIYAAGGDRAFGKERLEVMGGGRVAVLDDFRTLELVADGKRTRRRERLRPDKGHRGQWQALVQAVRSGEAAPISLQEIIASHLATYAVLDSLTTRAPVPVDLERFWQEVAG